MRAAAGFADGDAFVLQFGYSGQRLLTTVKHPQGLVIQAAEAGECGGVSYRASTTLHECQVDLVVL